MKIECEYPHHKLFILMKALHEAMDLRYISSILLIRHGLNGGF